MPEPDTVVWYDIGVVPEAAISGAYLLQSEDDSFLLFNAMRESRARKDEYVDAGIALVTIELCSVTKFGYPNDEALPGHPLYKQGLDLHGYGVCEVLNSSWISQLTEQNRVSFPNTPKSDQHHWIFMFHDSTFECIARALKVEVFPRPFDAVFAQASARLLKSPIG
jgi:hypothetical protein